MDALFQSFTDPGIRAGHEALSVVDDWPTTHEIGEFVARHYGLSATVTPLSSERDANYRVAAADGQRYVFKLAHSAEDRAVVDLHIEVLRHLQRSAPSIPLQRLVPAVDGAATLAFAARDGQQRLGWMLTYLAGAPLSGCDFTPAHAAQLGRLAADLDVALSGIAHHSAARGLLWDIQHASQTRALLAHTHATVERGLCEQALDRFELHTARVLPGLRAQLIHNDLNPHNVLVAEDDLNRISGIIDFGDMVAAPLVNEIAIAAAYLVSATAAPLGLAAQCISAYHARNPLLPAEIALIPSLMAARHAITIAITNWRATRHPENRRYIIRNQPSVIEGLRKLSALGDSRTAQLLAQACETSVHER